MRVLDDPRERRDAGADADVELLQRAAAGSLPPVLRRSFCRFVVVAISRPSSRGDACRTNFRSVDESTFAE
jgi:hypothetical protein